MRNTLLIARREYRERIRARSFVVMTVLIPVLMGGGLFTSIYFSPHARAPHITIVSPDTDLAIRLQDELAAAEPGMTVDAISPPTPDTMHILSGDVEDREMEGFLWVDAAAPRQAIFYGKPSDHLQGELEDALTQAAPQANLSLPVVVSVQSIRKSQRESTSLSPSQSAKSLAYFLFFLMYFSVMMYGVNVARSITEEKTSRVFEVMLATVTPEEMMAGKVIGVGGVGLTQVAIWIAAAAVLLATPLVPMIAGGSLSVALSFGQMLFFMLMFVLGFTLYASIAAILGAVVNSEQELGQLNMILAMPLAFCLIVSYSVAEHPNGLLAVITSLLPPCTPLLMFTRVAVGHPPLWQVALSVVDLVLAIYAMMWVASRIYRVGILMYGKRPSLSEILRWMRYS
ncbi:MAG TPA: ABC transporter permease [Acidobacteriaceae bacterium]|jgi:ABC-2 type transport system permease protein|nr:ABC transporter permease [Acidobacteriaceae bacterium]